MSDGQGWTKCGYIYYGDGTRQHYQYRTVCMKCKKPSTPIELVDPLSQKKHISNGCSECPPTKSKGTKHWAMEWETQPCGDIENAPDEISGLALECEGKESILAWRKSEKK